jgi:7,8-dihydropterin-6-yl-methyl-4-(beta-D-ribofuranosyl)aminobenzene 5'-phosphate synthase
MQPNDRILVTTLVENSVNIAGLCAEHGLAFLIRAGDSKVLFDTGQSGLLLANAEQMGFRLAEIQAVALSHGHYDHTGGLDAVLRLAPAARVFAHPAAIASKFTANADGSVRQVGMDPRVVGLLKAREHLVTWSSAPLEIAGGIYLTGEIPRRNTYEDTGGRFYLDSAAVTPDPLFDDQALFFDTSDGVVVVLGCAHSGVVNTLEYVRELTGERQIFAVIGGMHLLAAGPERMEKTIETLHRFDVQKLVPGHCTGISAVARLWAEFPSRCALCPVGTTIQFSR